MGIDQILLIIAFICFVVAALQVATPRVNLVAAGLACWILTSII